MPVGVSGLAIHAMPQRRFPSPWSVERSEACLIVRHHGGQALAYVYFRRSRGGARRLTYDEAWRIAANIGKLPQGAAAEATGLYRPHFRYDLNSRHFAGLRSLTSWATSGHSVNSLRIVHSRP
jgi:hypothetical protein